MLRLEETPSFGEEIQRLASEVQEGAARAGAEAGRAVPGLRGRPLGGLAAETPRNEIGDSPSALRQKLQVQGIALDVVPGGEIIEGLDQPRCLEALRGGEPLQPPLQQRRPGGALEVQPPPPRG
jgi:hypothetical protein